MRNLSKRHQLYSNGKQKLVKNLSVVSFVKMQLKLKTILRLLMDKKQRLLTVYSKLNKINISSGSSQDDSSAKFYMPKMLDKDNLKQEHSENIVKFIDEYTKKPKYTLNDLRLLHGVYSSKELTDIKIMSDNISQSNLYCDLSHNLRNNSVNQSEPILKPLNLMKISDISLFERYEEQKQNSPKSGVSVSNLVQDTNRNIVE